MNRNNWIRAFKPALLAALLLTWALPSWAQGKIAIVDMKKAFEGYYKTKQAEGQIKERATDSDKVYKGMVEDYQKANEEYRKLVESSNDQAVSAEEREKRKKNAESKLLEIQEIEKSVKQFQAQTRTTITEMEKRMRENIIREIRDVVNSRSRAGAFNLVMDSSAQTVYQTPFILFTSGQTDLTEEVLKELNATAPPGALEGTETSAKPDPLLDLPKGRTDNK